jgi:D-beta-D-heptose 7-phosphate kinase / D-beta-D-heptose 1-phosphate adenosyltransferase
MKVLVIGDVIIDKYIYGTSERLSPEAPIPIVKHKTTFERSGGAGNLYQNLKSLGVDVELLDLSSPKCIKTRVFSDGHYVTRIDEDFRTDGDATLAAIKDIDFFQYNYVVLSDYDKGVLDCSKQIIKHINQFDCKVLVDPKRPASYYEGAWLIKPNMLEESQYGFGQHHWNWIVTDAKGPVRARIDKVMYTVQPEQVEVNDVTGAGDCFLAAFVYSLTKGYDYEKCLTLAARGATESVKRTGTYTLTEADLKKRVIFTNGCFDILHKGHLTLLKEARALGDKLIVGLNSDASVKRLKGAARPVNDEVTRREQLELIPYVDEVIMFEDDTPYELIKTVKPDLIVKGGDYTVEEIVGHDLAPVHIIATVEGHSTTKIIEATK